MILKNKGEAITKREYSSEIKKDYRRNILYPSLLAYFGITFCFLYSMFILKDLPFLAISSLMLILIVYITHISQKAYSPIKIFSKGILWPHSIFDYLFSRKSLFTFYDEIKSINIKYCIAPPILEFLEKEKIYPKNEIELLEIIDTEKILEKIRKTHLKEFIIMCDFEIIQTNKKKNTVYGKSKEEARFIKEYIKKGNPTVEIKEDYQNIINQFVQKTSHSE